MLILCIYTAPSFSEASHTVINVGGEEHPRLISCVNASQGFRWNQGMDMFPPPFLSSSLIPLFSSWTICSATLPTLLPARRASLLPPRPQQRNKSNENARLILYVHEQKSSSPPTRTTTSTQASSRGDRIPLRRFGSAMRRWGGCFRSR